MGAPPICTVQTLETNPATIRNSDFPAPPTLPLLTIRNASPDLPAPPIHTVAAYVPVYRNWVWITFASLQYNIMQ